MYPVITAKDSSKSDGIAADVDETVELVTGTTYSGSRAIKFKHQLLECSCS
jgi:hypothetical protein